MLVLSRKRNEKIVLNVSNNEQIELTIVKIDANKVRIGIQASDQVKILRQELATKEKEDSSEDVKTVEAH